MNATYRGDADPCRHAGQVLAALGNQKPADPPDTPVTSAENAMVAPAQITNSSKTRSIPALPSPRRSRAGRQLENVRRTACAAGLRPSQEPSPDEPGEAEQGDPDQVAAIQNRGGFWDR